MKSFARFLSIIVVWWLSESSWRSLTRCSGNPTRPLDEVLNHYNTPLLHGMATKQRFYIYPIDLHARDLAFALFRKMREP